MLEQIRVRKAMFAEGGTTTKTQTKTPVFDQPQSNSADNKALTLAINRLNSNLENGITANAYIGDRMLVEMNERIKKLEESQNKGRA
jgi:hypothetical protein